MNDFRQQPVIEGLNQLDVSILMGKYSLLLGMINFGTTQQKTNAKKILQELEPYVFTHIHPICFELANRNLGFTNTELEFLEEH